MAADVRLKCHQGSLFFQRGPMLGGLRTHIAHPLGPRRTDAFVYTPSLTRQVHLYGAGRLWFRLC